MSNTNGQRTKTIAVTTLVKVELVFDIEVPIDSTRDQVNDLIQKALEQKTGVIMDHDDVNDCYLEEYDSMRCTDTVDNSYREYEVGSNGSGFNLLTEGRC